ncbi:glyoxalase domain-containing protein 4 isoform X2 [Hydra vulgaris]|uniref:Glyoxalase domain-containing protein 4 isoform X2 n=1 Tax=Hydra vulgaris TaxID=6087 RepID=A0ABM4BQW7_HYDVU
MNVRRALHFVFRISNRKATIDFYKNVLGMNVLRHEEFEKGCEAACNGPYDGKWSKTMIGYGEEDSHFVIELVYNYGTKSYRHGNDFLGISIGLKSIVDNISNFEVKSVECDNGLISISDPDGYPFIINGFSSRKDPVTKVSLAVSNIEKSVEYWNGLLGMNILERSPSSVLLSYSEDQCSLELVKSQSLIDHGDAYGRVAFSCPKSQLQEIEAAMRAASQIILTPYVSLDTPGKATVQVVILADPDGHEICFVGDEGFRELSKIDPGSTDLLYKAIEEDKSDEWFAKKNVVHAS